jgi:hypothetical protein
VKLTRDCQIVGTRLSEADVPLTEADINVSYTAEVTRLDKPARGGDRKKMNYNDFLTGAWARTLRGEGRGPRWGAPARRDTRRRVAAGRGRPTSLTRTLPLSRPHAAQSS